jgi:heme/copper-type cytochrome/quinol oxidase subunit 2
VGGIIFAAIMDSNSIDSLTLCIIASVVVIIMLTGVFLLYSISKKTKQKITRRYNMLLIVWLAILGSATTIGIGIVAFVNRKELLKKHTNQAV